MLQEKVEDLAAQLKDAQTIIESKEKETVELTQKLEDCKTLNSQYVEENNTLNETILTLLEVVSKYNKIQKEQ